MNRKTHKKSCKKCKNYLSPVCTTCKHNYTSNYQERVSRPSYDKAGENLRQPVKPVPETMTPDEAYEALKGDSIKPGFTIYCAFVCSECKLIARDQIHEIGDRHVCDKCFSRMSGPGPELG